MEILFISHKYPPTTGGMEKHSYELVAGMKKCGPVHSLIYKGVGSRFGFFLALRKNIKRILDHHPNITLIHFNDALIATYYLLCCRFHSQIKHAVTIHGLDVVFPSYLYRKFMLPKLNRFDLILAVSSATAQAARDLGIRAEKIRVISNGVDEKIPKHKFSLSFYDDFQTRYHLDIREKKLLVALGRPVKRKGFSWFIENVMPQLEHDYLLLLIGPFHWKPTKQERFLKFLPPFIRNKFSLFLGAPTDEPKLRALLHKPEIRKRAKHLGRLPFDEILNILHHARAFIMPNIEVKGDMEGFGLVCLEAALCGTTVLASCTGGIPDAIKHGKNGYLLAAEQAEEWVIKLNEVMKQPIDEEKIKISINYTKRHYSWKKMVKTYYQAFLDLVD
ncbi:glycosyltransferase family 4 protein [Olivibacter sp. CPCC 100613]|uniref:glycosyltransferase family 4 protein n=1 Tax=Olivibacter sp. CPCC 100613 TaxID=3079931 RepID=UPI002FF87727